jgi:hypothetical protein
MEGVVLGVIGAINYKASYFIFHFSGFPSTIANFIKILVFH